MDDYFRELREREDEARKRREQREADRQAKKAAEAEYEDAWKAVIKMCAAGDEQPDITPDLSSVIALASVLRQRGWHEWLPEMAEKQKEPPGQVDPIIYRPGSYWMVRLIQAAQESERAEQLTSAYQSFKADKWHWRAQAAIDVQYFFFLRINAPPVPPAPPVSTDHFTEPEPSVPPEPESPRGKHARTLLAALFEHHGYDAVESALSDVEPLTGVEAVSKTKIDKGNVSRAFDQLFPGTDGRTGYERYRTLDRTALLTHFLSLARDRQEFISLTGDAAIGSKLA